MTDLVCDDCGASVPADAAYCSECGAGLQPESADYPDSDEEVEQAKVLEKYDDKWYEHDGSKTNYAVILEDGSKKYYKELTWAEKRLKDEYEGQDEYTAMGSSSSRSDDEKTTDSRVSDSEDSKASAAEDTSTSADSEKHRSRWANTTNEATNTFSKFPGISKSHSKRRNIIIGSAYLLFFSLLMVAAEESSNGGDTQDGDRESAADQSTDANDDEHSSPDTDQHSVDIESVIEVTDTEVGLSPLGTNDQAPGYFEYEVKNTGEELRMFYVHVVFVDGNGSEVLCNSYFHSLWPGETDSEYTNPAFQAFDTAEIVEIVERGEGTGYCD